VIGDQHQYALTAELAIQGAMERCANLVFGKQLTGRRNHSRVDPIRHLEGYHCTQ
jgi:hypothetical protein